MRLSPPRFSIEQGLLDPPDRVTTGRTKQSFES